MEYSGRWSLLPLTIVRNFNIVLLNIHYGACALYYIGEWVEFNLQPTTPETESAILDWLALDRLTLDQLPAAEKYVLQDVFKFSSSR